MDVHCIIKPRSYVLTNSPSSDTIFKVEPSKSWSSNTPRECMIDLCSIPNKPFLLFQRAERKGLTDVRAWRAGCTAFSNVALGIATGGSTWSVLSLHLDSVCFDLQLQLCQDITFLANGQQSARRCLFLFSSVQNPCWLMIVATVYFIPLYLIYWGLS